MFLIFFYPLQYCILYQHQKTLKRHVFVLIIQYFNSSNYFYSTESRSCKIIYYFYGSVITLRTISLNIICLCLSKKNLTAITKLVNCKKHSYVFLYFALSPKSKLLCAERDTHAERGVE